MVMWVVQDRLFRRPLSNGTLGFALPPVLLISFFPGYLLHPFISWFIFLRTRILQDAKDYQDIRK